MERLNCNELRSLCKGLGLATSGLKWELVERVERHLSNFDSTQPEMRTEEQSNNERHVSIFRRMQRGIIQPFRSNSFRSNPLRGFPLPTRELEFSTNIGSAQNQQHKLRIPWTMCAAVLLGVVGGLHSLAQLIAFFFASPLSMYIPRNW